MPRAAAVKEGATFTAGEAGWAGGTIAPGTDVTVVELTSADVDGIGGEGEQVLIEWKVPALVQGDNGVELGEQTRRTTIPAGEFADAFGG